MAEVSNNSQVNNEAWQLYYQMQTELAQLAQSTGAVGKPDPNDPNSAQASTQTS